ncbi:MAG: hypothetical protein KKB51_08660 [Candidatus Riflebacteria bacterium]|nr:hypothetical protein [Candidatus Riflebacteria bacterium]
MEKNVSPACRLLFSFCYPSSRCKLYLFCLLAVVVVISTNGFRPNYGQKIYKDCLANMVRMNRVLAEHARTASNHGFAGTGESIASYPEVLQSFADGCPVCPLFENQSSGFKFYCVVRASDSFEVSCHLHGSRSDFDSGKEIVVTEKHIQMVTETVNRQKMLFFVKVLLINVIVAVIFWFPAILMRFSGKQTRFVKTFKITLKAHKAILIALLLACLAAVIVIDNPDHLVIIHTTAASVLVLFIAVKFWGLSWMPQDLYKTSARIFPPGENQK